MSDAKRPSRARLSMLSHVPESRWRVGCATPGPWCHEYPLFFATLNEARVEAREHAEEHEHVSNITHVQSTPIEFWATADNAGSGS